MSVVSAAPAAPHRPRTRTAYGLTALVALVALAAAIVCSLPLGSSDIGLADLAHPGRLSELQRSVIWELRLPRVLMAACVGAILAVCGAAMQAITSNDLADPYLLGISSGASTGAVIAIVFASFQWGVIAGAAIGAVASFALLMALLRGSKADTTRVVLTGVLVGYLFQALRRSSSPPPEMPNPPGASCSGCWACSRPRAGPRSPWSRLRARWGAQCCG